MALAKHHEEIRIKWEENNWEKFKLPESHISSSTKAKPQNFLGKSVTIRKNHVSPIISYKNYTNNASMKGGLANVG